MSHTSHTIQTLLDEERLEAFIDGSPYMLLCAYDTRQHGFSNAVYVQDGGHDVVIEQDHTAAVMGLFSTETHKLPQLLDYLEATISRGDGFRYCLTGNLQSYLDEATSQGRRYPLLEQALQPEKASFLEKTMRRFRRQPELSASLRSDLTAHSVPVVHLPSTIKHLDFVTDHSIGNLAQSREAALSSVQSTAKTTPAKGLPEGWEWVEYDDDSGMLQSPKGDIYFAHTRRSGLSSECVDYYETLDDHMRTLHGSKEDFKQYAVSIVNTAYLKRKDALEHTIHSAVHRKTEHPAFSDVKLKEQTPER